MSCDGVSRISFEAIKLLGAKTWVAKLKDSMTLKSRDPKLFAMHAPLKVRCRARSTLSPASCPLGFVSNKTLPRSYQLGLGVPAFITYVWICSLKEPLAME